MKVPNHINVIKKNLKKCFNPNAQTGLLLLFLLLIQVALPEQRQKKRTGKLPNARPANFCDKFL